MKWSALLVSLLAVPMLAASGMHGNDEVSCELYGGPEGHAVDDGHEHYHHTHETALGHYHGPAWHDAGHTHGAHGHGGHGNASSAGHNGHMGPEHMANHHDVCDQTGRHAHPHGVATDDYDGPTLEDLEERGSVWIHGDSGFQWYNVPGNGTAEDPYVFENGWYDYLYIANTDACFVVRNNVIGFTERTRTQMVNPPNPDWTLIPDENPLSGAEIDDDWNQVRDNLGDSTWARVDQVAASLRDAEIGDQVLDRAKFQQLRQRLQGDYNDTTREVDLNAYWAYLEHLIPADPVDWSEPRRIARDLYEQSFNWEYKERYWEDVGQLVLDWNGDCVEVHHNAVSDLRVNQNNPRTGFATGGLITDNFIRYIGQLRHYDGDFRGNLVGPRDVSLEQFAPVVNPTDPSDNLQGDRLVNVDGFNQGMIRQNLFLGSVDLDYHGHHHGAGFYSPHSHYHGNIDAKKYMYDANGTLLLDDYGNPATHHNHSRRWTSVGFTDNVILDPYGYGLRYEDRNHQADDQVAASENVASLAYPHKHQSHITLEGNRILGHLVIDDFNGHGGWVTLNGTRMLRHQERNDGWLDIHANTVILNERYDGNYCYHFGCVGKNALALWSTDMVDVDIRGNIIGWDPLTRVSGVWVEPEPEWGQIDDGLPWWHYWRQEIGDRVLDELKQDPDWTPGRDTRGIYMATFDDANVDVIGNAIVGFEDGVYAIQFASDVHWEVWGNVMVVEDEEVDQGWGVSNPPDRDPLP